MCFLQLQHKYRIRHENLAACFLLHVLKFHTRDVKLGIQSVFEKTGARKWSLLQASAFLSQIVSFIIFFTLTL